MQVSEGRAWQQLKLHCDQGMGSAKLSDLILEDNRMSAFSIEMEGLFVDLSKNRLSSETLPLLEQLAEECDLEGWIAKLFSGEKVNASEDRAALHTLLRQGFTKSETPKAPGVGTNTQTSKAKAVEGQLQKMAEMVEKIRTAQWRGASGRAITDVVNIGVGGSDLGPLMVTESLQAMPQVSSINVHFISSIDGTQTSNVLKSLDPKTTLFILASKSFETIDTLVNAETAVHWLEQAGLQKSEILSQHFIGISTKPDKMAEWGILPKNQLEFWDWVGGRYSMWSAIGLPIAIKVGMDGFYDFLAGAAEMDEHFQTAPIRQNIPAMLALIDIWNVNFLDIPQKAILPYDARLKYLPAYLSQLVMESNGKSVDREGKAINYQTCPIIWGEVGPNAQHAFYQLLHQGTRKIMCDFIAISQRDDFDGTSNENIDQSFLTQHSLSLANCLAQSRVLMLGDDAIPECLRAEFDNPFKHYPGNQPSNTLVLDELSPNSIGKLIALYEHKTFVESVIWNINPFDQWGVELGKLIAKETHAAMTSEEVCQEFDPSTRALIKRLKYEN